MFISLSFLSQDISKSICRTIRY